MRHLLLFASVLFATSSAYEYVTCDKGNGISLIADKSTQCKDFFICYQGRMTRHSCPDGYVFDDFVFRCVPAYLSTCVEESKENELTPIRNKRSVVSFHSIHKGQAKEAAWHFMESMKTDAMNALMEAAPSVHDSVKNKYIPFLKLMKNATLPVFEQHVLPRLQKACTYGKNLGARVFSKVYRSWEISNSTHINLVSFSDIASDLSNDLKLVMQLGKYFSTRLTTRHKRSITISKSLLEAENELTPIRNKRSVVSFHSIHKGQAKEAAWHFMESMKTNAMDALMEAAPSVHDSVINKYIPFLKLMKNATMPVFEQHVLPRLQKVCAYGKNLGARVFRKVYRSWEISNSTHINLVSFSDIASDLSNDLKPVMQLGKYFSSRLTTRHKRSITPYRSLFETVYGFLQPVASSVFKMAASLAVGDDPFLRDYVLPMVFKMMDHPQTEAEIKEIVWIAKGIYTPIVSEIFNGSTYRDFDGVVFQVSNPVLEDAKFRLYTEVKPIVSNIFERHLQMILYRSGVHLPLITETLERMEAYSGDEVKDLKHDLLLFFTRHSEFFATSNKSFRNVKTFTEMKKDLEPIKKKLLKVAMDYLSHSPNAMFNFLFGRNSYLYRLL